MSVDGRHVLVRLYELVLGVAAGFSLGFFTWVMADRFIQSDRLPLWPFAITGTVAISAIVFWARRSPGKGRWIHLMWVPVGVFVVLMALVVMALRRLT
jgi:hypothetical protein